MSRELIEEKQHRRWGMAAIALAVVAGLIVLAIHVFKPGDVTLKFAAADASGITVGQQVRVAGVGVGTVTSVTARERDALVTAKIDGGVHIGDLSSVSVRMLTAVGGYYVEITTAGTRTLGDSVIPVSRVELPYTIASTIESVGGLGDAVDTDLVARSLKTATDALRGNPNSIGSVADAAHAVVGVLNSQSVHVKNLMSMVEEYAKTLADNRELLWSVIGKAAIAMKVLSSTRDGWTTTIERVKELFQNVDPVSRLYLQHREDLAALIDNLSPIADQISKAVTPAINNLNFLVTKLQEISRSLGSPKPSLLATDICVSVGGSRC